jgi:ATP-dependent RNA helicase DeaD
VSDKTDHPPLPQAFAELGVRNSVLRGLADAQFTEPSEIQKLLIPKALTGVDLLGQARTGTGKTAAFGIPILQMAEKGVAVQALIMVPTRELAVQVVEELRRLAKHTPIRAVSVVGGQRITAQVKELSHNPEIVVGTPGRVIDLLDRRLMNLDNIRFVVLDEVDRMLDIGFRDDIRNILSRLKGRSATDAEGQSHQTVFVSATISDEIERLARKYMREPVEKLVAPGADEKPTVDKIEQFALIVDPWDKYRLLKRLIEDEKPEMAIVFTRTKHAAEHLAKSLTHDGINCREIHGNLKQNKRDSVMKGLRAHKFEMLVATDLASRGIDVAGITHIFNFDIPEDPEVYVHRIGRTARMGREGRAFTFVMRDQGEMLTKIENLINMEIPVLKPEGWEPRPPRPDFVPKGSGPGVRDGMGGPARTAKPAGSTAPTPPPPQTISGTRKATLGSKFKTRRR